MNSTTLHGSKLAVDIDTMIDPEFESWYAPLGLPPDLADRHGDGPVRLSWEDFVPIESATYAKLGTFGLIGTEMPWAPAHGYIHASRVMWNGKCALDMLERILGIRFPEGFKQRVMLAFIHHDWRHPGATYYELARQENLPDVSEILPGSILDYTVEYGTSVLVNEMYKNTDLRNDVAGALLETFVIWSSTARPANKYSKRLGVDAISPRSFLGCLMAALDVLCVDEFVYAMQFEIDLFYCEQNVSSLPSDRETYMKGRGYFLRYIADRFSALDEAARNVARSCGLSTDFTFTAIMGWRDRLDAVCQQYEMLKQGNPEAWMILNGMIIQRGGKPL